MKIIKRYQGRSPGSWISDELHLPLRWVVLQCLLSTVTGPRVCMLLIMLRLPYYPQRIGGTLTVFYSIAVIISARNGTVKVIKQTPSNW